MSDEAVIAEVLEKACMLLDGSPFHRHSRAVMPSLSPGDYVLAKPTIHEWRVDLP
jgi:hypothetical protein